MIGNLLHIPFETISTGFDAFDFGAIALFKQNSFTKINSIHTAKVLSLQ